MSNLSLFSSYLSVEERNAHHLFSLLAITCFSFLSENPLFPLNWIEVILIKGPSLISKIRSTRLFSNSIILGSIEAPNRPESS